jgi:hypothetical protein
MDADRMRVLEMLEQGKITARDAATLLDALAAGDRASTKAPGRTMRLRVTDVASGRLEANVSLPLGVFRTIAGMGTEIRRGLSPYLGDLDTAGLFEAIESGQTGRLLDVAIPDAGRRIEIIVE